MGLFLLLLSFQPTDPVDIIREGYLPDINDFAHIGLVIDHYRWFDSREWVAEQVDKGQLVTFRGEMPDEPAVEDFHAENRYKLSTGFKSMQLYSFYELDEDKQKLRFTIRFLITENRNFKVHSGSLGVLTNEGTWREKDLENRALVKVIEGIYGNDNPYLSLVEGMPFE